MQHVSQTIRGADHWLAFDKDNIEIILSVSNSTANESRVATTHLAPI
jgi:hypothetical protein